MRKLIFCLMLFVLMPTLLFAGTWCQWSGTEGENCKSTALTYIVISGVRVTVSAENLNPRGWYELITTEPSVGADQTKDQVVWGFVSNQVTKTWTVRDLTQTEIYERAAMPINDYLQWKAFVQGGVFTQQALINWLQTNYPEIVTSFQARDALENP